MLEMVGKGHEDIHGGGEESGDERKKDGMGRIDIIYKK